MNDCEPRQPYKVDNAQLYDERKADAITKWRLISEAVLSDIVDN